MRGADCNVCMSSHCLPGPAAEVRYDLPALGNVVLPTELCSSL